MISLFWGIDVNGCIAAKDSDNLYNTGYLCVHNMDSLVLTNRYTQSKTQKQKYMVYMDFFLVQNFLYAQQFLHEKRMYQPQNPI